MSKELEGQDQKWMYVHKQEYEQLRAELAAANQRAESAERKVREYEEREAACCSEDIGFEEVIQKMRERAEQAEAQTAAMRMALKKAKASLKWYYGCDEECDFTEFALSSTTAGADLLRRLEAAEKVCELGESITNWHTKQDGVEPLWWDEYAECFEAWKNTRDTAS